jgi:uncharacterized protein (TIGR03085 family)
VTSIAAHERALLCALAQQLGPDAPTLCGGWTVKDLVVHLLLREGHPSAVAILVPGLGGVLDRATEKASAEDFSTLVKRLRHGPPVWSPFAVPKLGAALNLLEFFVHHEDVRRAQPDWEPRALPEGTEDGIWRPVRLLGRGTVRRAPVGVVLERSDTEERVTLKKGDRQVVVRGLPSELGLYVYGRQSRSRVERLGDAADVAALDGASLGL